MQSAGLQCCLKTLLSICVLCVMYTTFTFIWTTPQEGEGGLASNKPDLNWKSQMIAKLQLGELSEAPEDEDFKAEEWSSADAKIRYRKMLKEHLKIWKTCPKRDRSLDSIMITVMVDDSGLGNQVWEYLSAWALARRYGIRPVMSDYNVNRLSKMFERKHFSIPTLSTVGRKCNMLPWILEEYKSPGNYVQKPKEALRAFQVPAKENVTLFKSVLYSVDTYNASPLWLELSHDLVVREELRKEADQRLRDIRRDFYYSYIKRTNQTLNMRDIQFVAVHIRRSDYVKHLPKVHKGAQMVDENYYLHAFKWLKEQLPTTTLIFIVVTDDKKWAEEKLEKNRTDVFLPGSGEIKDPYQDMALMAACNHTIFAYGTFALTAALLANGGYTIVYDIGNKEITKEMQFATWLSRWYIMDSKGVLQYENIIATPTFHPV